MEKGVYQNLFFAALAGFIIAIMLLLFVLDDNRRTTMKMLEQIEQRDTVEARE